MAEGDEQLDDRPGLGQIHSPGDFSCGGGAEGDEQREAGPGPGQIHSPGHSSCGEGGGAEGDEQLDVMLDLGLGLASSTLPETSPAEAEQAQAERLED